MINPLFKKGDDKKPDNYRGISLLSIVSQVFTSILNKRLTTWAEETEEKMCKEQAGFREGYSTLLIIILYIYLYIYIFIYIFINSCKVCHMFAVHGHTLLSVDAHS